MKISKRKFKMLCIFPKNSNFEFDINGTKNVLKSEIIHILSEFNRLTIF